MAPNSECFNRHLLETYQDIHQQTMLLAILLQIHVHAVNWLQQRVNNNCVAYYLWHTILWAYVRPTNNCCISLKLWQNIPYIQLIQKCQQIKNSVFLLPMPYCSKYSALVIIYTLLVLWPTDHRHWCWCSKFVANKAIFTASFSPLVLSCSDDASQHVNHRVA